MKLLIPGEEARMKLLDCRGKKQNVTFESSLSVRLSIGNPQISLPSDRTLAGHPTGFCRLRFPRRAVDHESQGVPSHTLKQGIGHGQ